MHRIAGLVMRLVVVGHGRLETQLIDILIWSHILVMHWAREGCIKHLQGGFFFV